MSSYGHEVIGTIDLNSTQVLSDGHDADWKSVGHTFDWSLVTAPVSDVELPDGNIIPAGVKYVRYGDFVSEITASKKFGPLRTNATDGREVIEAGRIFVVNRTIREDHIASDHSFELFDGGRIWEARLLVGGTNQLTLAQAKAAFPRLSYTR